MIAKTLKNAESEVMHIQTIDLSLHTRLTVVWVEEKNCLLE